MTRLDEISRVIGGMEESLKAMGRSMDRDRMEANQRHRENTDALDLISGRVENLERSVSPLALTVEKMKPIVESVIVSRWKLAGALTAASIIFAGLGWVVVVVVNKLGAWAMSKFP